MFNKTRLWFREYKRRIWVFIAGGGMTFLALLFSLSQAGVIELEGLPEDRIDLCDDICNIQFNVTYVGNNVQYRQEQLCIGNDKDLVFFDDELVSYEFRKKNYNGSYELFNPKGACFDKNVKEELLLHIFKEPNNEVKWSFIAGNVDIDPLLLPKLKIERDTKKLFLSNIHGSVEFKNNLSIVKDKDLRDNIIIKNNFVFGDSASSPKNHEKPHYLILEAMLA